MSTSPLDSPRLVADIGGTYACLTLETTPGVFERAATLRCADNATPMAREVAAAARRCLAAPAQRCMA